MKEEVKEQEILDFMDKLSQETDYDIALAYLTICFVEELPEGFYLCTASWIPSQVLKSIIKVAEEKGFLVYFDSERQFRIHL